MGYYSCRAKIRIQKVQKTFLEKLYTTRVLSFPVDQFFSDARGPCGKSNIFIFFPTRYDDAGHAVLSMQCKSIQYVLRPSHAQLIISYNLFLMLMHTVVRQYIVTKGV